MIVAFSVFVALLGTVAGVLLWKSNQLSKTGAQTPQRASEPAVSAVFYDRIGTGQLETEAPVKSPARSSYTLEIKATTSRSEAEAVVDSLQKDGIEAYYTPLNNQGRIVYRVRRGIFTTAEAAKNAAVALKDSRGIASKVTQLQ
jgi:septal ring-binding cell division protein DamX